MILIYDDLWRKPPAPGMIVVPAGSLILDGELIMTYGAAREAIGRIPGIAARCANAIRATKDDPYGFLEIFPPDGSKTGFGILQTSWKNDAEIELIAHSAKIMAEYAEAHPDYNIRLSFPSGQLDIQDVLEALDVLPTSVKVCHTGLGSVRMGVKDLLDGVRRELHNGRQNGAVDLLVRYGWDRNLAERQVQSVIDQFYS